MNKPVQEALERGTYAIKKGEIEWDARGKGYSVRYKNLAGYVVRRKFTPTEQGFDDSWDFFWKLKEKLEAEVQKKKGRF